MTANLPLPLIVYPSGSNPPTTGTAFTFVYPPRLVPYRSYAAVRHDNVSDAGVREPIFVRTDAFLEFTMEWAKLANDIGNWDSFMQYALQGGPFDYYPDSTVSGIYTTYVLEDTTWSPDYKQLGMYTFKAKFRKAVNWP